MKIIAFYLDTKQVRDNNHVVNVMSRTRSFHADTERFPGGVRKLRQEKDYSL